jgi:hypothetical protein
VKGLNRRLATVLVLGLLMVMGAALPAQAQEADRGYCTAGGDTLHATVYHSPRTNGTTYVDYVSMTITGNNAEKNNLTAHLHGNGGGITYWAGVSGDDIRGERTVQWGVNEVVPRSTNPYVRFSAVMDQTGPDPSCWFHVYLY